MLHLEEQQELEREEAEHKMCLELENSEFNRKRALLKAKQNVQEASVELQVMEEELERGGYLPTEPLNSV